jgi:hypothetical protein
MKHKNNAENNDFVQKALRIHQNHHKSTKYIEINQNKTKML